LQVIKSTLEFVRFEAEVENCSKLKMNVNQLDQKTIKLSGFTEALKVRAAEAKSSFPTRHDWESYFRDAKNMNELNYGERPDTIHLRDLPCRWFANRKDKDRDIPSEFIVRKVFETFGDIRCMDIPVLDPYQKEVTLSTGSIQTFSFGQDILFEAFIQFTEYIGFVKAMTSLRGMKLLYKGEDGKALTANMKVVNNILADLNWPVQEHFFFCLSWIML
jgi:splicing factor, arginine/serine-rich 17